MFKFISEFGPIIAFLIGYKYGGIYSATLYMMVASVVGIILCYIAERKIHTFSLVSFFILLLAGGTTLISKNPIFIKIKPTILYLIFSIVLVISAYKNKPLLQYIFRSAIPLKDNAWYNLSYRFAVFFVFMAVLNEIVWRNFTEDTWVSFKVFGVVPITLVFILLQVPFFLKNKK